MTKLEALLEIRDAVARAPGLITGAYVSPRGVCAVGAAVCGPHTRRRHSSLRSGYEAEMANALLSALHPRNKREEADWIPRVNDQAVGTPAERRAYMLAYLDNRIAYHREHQGEPSPVEPMPTAPQEREPVTA